MANKKAKKKARKQLVEDRQVLSTLACDDEGWEILERACAQFGKDPLHVALSAVARELMRTSIDLEQETKPALKFFGRVACGYPGLDEKEQVELAAERARAS